MKASLKVGKAVLVILWMMNCSLQGLPVAYAQSPPVASESAVQLVQKKLIEIGYLADSANGKFGRKTVQAIIAYQADWNLPRTGQITEDLISRLERKHPATKSGWKTVQGSRCQVWNSVPQASAIAIWDGSCSEGKVSGTGKIYWLFVMRGISLKDTYQGGVLEGRLHGQGTYTWFDGYRYEGNWHDGEEHGPGTLTFADGGSYKGEWSDGKWHGRGTLTYAHGGSYSGEWSDGKKHGRGTGTWSDGDRYEGEWDNDIPNGWGTLYSKNDGRKYKGYWRSGCFSRDKDVAWIGKTKTECGF